MLRLVRIISGGQTGADQGALHAGRTLGLETGGYAPKGWLTELGTQKQCLQSFGLVECEATGFDAHTQKNVEYSDATVWFGHVDSPGAVCTLRAVERGKRLHLINPDTPDMLRWWLEEHRIRVLNVAGNRESKNPGITQKVYQFLLEALDRDFNVASDRPQSGNNHTQSEYIDEEADVTATPGNGNPVEI